MLESESCVKLPKIDVPTFNGNILHWNTFWEQFEVSILSKTYLTNVEKLAYLRHALKGGPANQAIEGLSRSADQYEEAKCCLKRRYDRPHFIHRAHIHTVLDAFSVKEGNGKDLWHLYVTNQHLRALTATEQDITESFITSLMEMKLDQAMMFEWQRHSQDSNDVPHYSALLEFLDLRAEEAENTVHESDHNC